MLCKWENLPSSMQNDEVKFYYDILQHKSRFARRNIF